MSLSGMPLSRSGWMLTTLAGLSVWFSGPHAGAAAKALAGADFPRALLGLASLLQLVTGIWVILIVGLAQVFGSSVALRAVTPRLLRGALFAGTAGALAITPASADRGVAPPRDHAVVNATNHNLAGLPFPDRPQSSRTLTGPARSQRDDQIVIVRPGDTLWAIARRSLRPGASEAEVAAASVEWFAANRAVIGNDPDLIFPAQRLHPPTKEHS